MSQSEFPPPEKSAVPPPISPRPKSRLQTFLIVGCLGMIIIAMLAVFGLYYGAKHFAGAVIAQYTQDHPLELPVVSLPDDQLAELQKRVQTFGADLKSGKATQPLTLTADQLNALIQNNPNWTDFPGKIHVSIDKGAIMGKISVPLGALKPDSTLLKGRYLNGAARFHVSIANNMLYVNMESITVGGKSLPQQLAQGFQTENLAKDVAKNKEAMKIIKQLASIEVKDDKIVLTPKKVANSAATGTAAPATSDKAN